MSESGYQTSYSARSAVGDDGAIAQLNKKASAEATQDAIFGVLFTLTKEKSTTSWKLAVLDLVLTWIQLFVLVVSKENSWSLPGQDGLFDAMQELSIPYRMHKAGYAIFVATFVVMIIILAGSIGLCAWVAHNFATNHFPYVWPIKVLRFMVAIFFRTFYVSVLNLLVVGPDCRTVDGKFLNDNFLPDKEVECFALPHVVIFALAIIAAISGFAISFLMAMAESSDNPMSDELLASPNSSFNQRFFVVMTIVTVSSVILTQLYKVYSYIFVVCSFIILWTIYRQIPYYVWWVNGLQAALYGTLSYSAICLVALSHSETDADREAASAACVYGLAPIALLCFLLMLWRMKMPAKTTLAVHRDGAATDVQFSSPTSIEICSRCMRIFDEHGNQQEDWINVAEAILNEGAERWPDDAQIQLHLSNFLQHVRHNGPDSLAALARMKKCELTMSDRFRLFVRDREAKQTQKGAGGGEGTMDLVSYVEFQNNFKQLLNTHGDSLVAIRGFWRTLLLPEITFRHIARTFDTLSNTKHRAQTMYRNMLDRYPKNVKLLRSYGRFLEDVKNDAGRAARYYEDADKIEDQQAEAQRDALFGETMATGEEGVEEGLMQETQVVDDTNDAVVVADDQGIIQMANRKLTQLFGYKMGELEGSNVNIMMPQPFSSQHSGFLRQAKMREGRLKRFAQQTVAMHKNGNTFPIRITITQLPQADRTAYMGVIRAADEEYGRGTLYVHPDGTILTASRGFTDILGWGPLDVAGQSICTIADAGSDIETDIQQAVTGILAGNSASSAERRNINFTASIRHKYAPITFECEVETTLGGTESNRLTILTFNCQPTRDGVLAMDTTARIVYANKTIDEWLGFSPGQLMEAQIPMGRIMPSPYQEIHPKCLARVIKSGEIGSGPPCSCFSARPKVFRGKNGMRVPLVMRFRPQMDGEKVVFTATVTKSLVPEQDGFRMGGISEVIDRPLRLRCVVLPDSTVVACCGGTGYSNTITGGILEVDANEELVGKHLHKHIDVMTLAIKNAKMYGNVDEASIIRTYLTTLATKCRELNISGVRVSFRPEPDDPEHFIACRYAMLPLDTVDLLALVQANKIDVAMQQRLQSEGGFVCDLWRADVLDGYLDIDKSFVVRNVSTQAAMLLGHTGSHLEGRSLGIHLEDPTRSVAALRTTVVQGMPGEVKFLHSDGDELTMFVNGAPKKGVHGRYAVLLRDQQTDLARDEAQLHAIEQLFRRDTSALGENPNMRSQTLVRAPAGVRFAATVQTLGGGGNSMAGLTLGNLSDSSDDEGEFEEMKGGDDENDEDQSQAGSAASGGSAGGGGSVTSGSCGESTVYSQSTRKRTKRFRRLRQMLRSAKVRRVVEDLILGVRVIVLLLLAVHAAIFGAVLTLMAQHDTLVVVTKAAGVGSADFELIKRQVYVIESTSRATGFPPSDVAKARRTLHKHVKVLDQTLETLWIDQKAKGNKFEEVDRVFQDPVLEVQQFYDSTPDYNETELMGLFWGTRLLTRKAKQAVNPPKYWVDQYGEGFITGFAAVDFVVNNVAIGDGIGAVLFAQQQKVNDHVALSSSIILATGLVEALVIYPAAAILVLWMVARLARTRMNLFSVFLSVPRPTVIALATKEVNVNEDAEEGEEEEDPWERQALTKEDRKAMEKAARRKHKGPKAMMQFTINKRSLKMNNARQLALMSVPLLLLAMVIMPLTIGSWSLLSEVSAPTDDLVGALRVRNAVSEISNKAAQLVVSEYEYLRAEIRTEMAESLATAQNLYQLLLFGGEREDPRYGKFKFHGLAYETPAIVQLLFDSVCLRENQTACLQPDHPWYKTANGGLDLALRTALEETRTLLNEHTEKLSVHNQHFRYMWEVSQNDVEYALVLFANAFEDLIRTRASAVTAMQAVLMALVAFCLACYLLLLRPYRTMAAREVMLVAELLSHLPENLPVEDLVKQVADVQDDTLLETDPFYVRYRRRIISGILRTLTKFDSTFKDLYDGWRDQHYPAKDEEKGTLVGGNKDAGKDAKSSKGGKTSGKGEGRKIEGGKLQSSKK